MSSAVALAPNLLVPASPNDAAIENLRAAGPAPGCAEGLQAFGQFVGVWDLDVRFYDRSGALEWGTPAVWMFSWILDGRGVQDVLVFPNRRNAQGERGVGTTLRYYDARLRRWKATFVGAQSGIVIHLEGGPAGDRIVLEGRDMDGSLLKWTFSAITSESFQWTGHSSADGGKTWWLEQEMSARRRGTDSGPRVASALWRRLDTQGSESARLARLAGGWELAGSAVFDAEGLAASLSYSIVCGDAWDFRTARVEGWLGGGLIRLSVRREADGLWFLNGTPCPEFTGCAEFDLNFSPSTNLIPIRRLGLKPGESAAVTAALLRFPSLRLERHEQRYTCIDRRLYRYESGQGAFKADLAVDDVGMVQDYAPVWQRLVTRA
ncbi:hypothetical protein GALL_191350 [mine drainage metagenome]|uniref:Uncharacterized protein n=1 Tax=mine drainage metagenome TaxID=410659 RepID=A0A1J5S3T8_9ZZZZ